MKTFLVTTSMICIAAAVLSGCTSDGSSQMPPMASTQPLMDESVPPAAAVPVWLPYRTPPTTAMCRSRR